MFLKTNLNGERPRFGLFIFFFLFASCTEQEPYPEGKTHSLEVAPSCSPLPNLSILSDEIYSFKEGILSSYEIRVSGYGGEPLLES